MADKPGKKPASHVADIVTPAQTKTWLIVGYWATSLVTTVIETFGWPGAALLTFFFFIVRYATEEQKRELIDLYVLGKGIGAVWPILVLSTVFIAVAAAQRYWYSKQIMRLEDEVDREGTEKGLLQEELLGRKLQHGKAKTRNRR